MTTLNIFRDIALLAVGALLGYFASLAMWKRQLREQGRQKRSDHILRAVHLATTSLTYTRSLLYSKTEGIRGVLQLPENPVDELLAIAQLQLGEIAPLVQQLHDKQQKIFEHPTTTPNASESMLSVAGELVTLVNQLTKKLRQLSEEQADSCR